MRAFGIRVLKNGAPVAVLLALLGYGLAQMAEMMTGKSDRPNPDGVPEMRAVLESRLPVTMAAWGLGFVVLFEALVSLWRNPLPPPTDPKPAAVQVDEAEQLLMKLLEEADAAERARSMPSPADPTPPPRGSLPAESVADSEFANARR